MIGPAMQSLATKLRFSMLIFPLVWAGASPAFAQAGSPLQKLADYKGKIVVLNFWASWCKPCRKEMPLLMELQREFGAQGVQFIGACTDKEEDRGQAKEFLNQKGIEYPVWFGLSDSEMTAIHLGTAIPATAVYDRDGKQIFRLIGEIKRKALRERLEWLLGDRSGKPPKELTLPLGVSSKPYRKP